MNINCTHCHERTIAEELSDPLTWLVNEVNQKAKQLKISHHAKPVFGEAKRREARFLKRLWYKTFLPFIFIFLQIKCGRCKTEQQYSLGLPGLLTFFIDVVLQMGLGFAAIYAFVLTNANGYLIGLIFLALYLIFCFIKTTSLLRKYA